jgi:lipase
VRLHVHSYGPGDGPPVVCLHGVTGHGERFRRLAEERLPGLRVHAFDLRGHGRSGYEPPWSLETHVGDILETAASVGVDGAAPWVGFSFGGRLVAELACHAPERVERIVLLDPALHLPPEQAYEAAEDERRGESFSSADEAIQARYDSGLVISTPREYLEEEMSRHLVRGDDGRLGFRYSHSAAVAAWGEMARPAPGVAAVPTLLVLGTESYVPNAENVSRYRDALGDGLRLLELRSGHSVLWDAFDETAAALASFLGA